MEAGVRNFGVPGFSVTKSRSQHRPLYPVLARLKTGMQMDSDSSAEVIPEYHRMVKLSCPGFIKFYKRPRHWSIKFWLYCLPKFRGDAGESPREHLEKLHDKVKRVKPDELELDLLIAFPQSLHGHARRWFMMLLRRKVMTWGEVVDRFLQQFAV